MKAVNLSDVRKECIIAKYMCSYHRPLDRPAPWITEKHKEWLKIYTLTINGITKEYSPSELEYTTNWQWLISVIVKLNETTSLNIPLYIIDFSDFNSILNHIVDTILHINNLLKSYNNITYIEEL